MIARLLLAHRNTPRHCGMPMWWDTWRACWVCASARCEETA